MFISTMSDEENETNMFQNAVAFWKAKGQHVEKVIFHVYLQFKVFEEYVLT